MMEGFGYPSLVDVEATGQVVWILGHFTLSSELLVAACGVLPDPDLQSG